MQRVLGVDPAPYPSWWGINETKIFETCFICMQKLFNVELRNLTDWLITDGPLLHIVHSSVGHMRSNLFARVYNIC